MKEFNKAVFFDMDGVIVFSEHQHFGAWQSVFTKLGLPKAALNFEDFIGATDNDVASALQQKFNLSNTIANLCAAKRESFFESQNSFDCIPGVIDYIDKLKSENTWICVVSSSTRAEIKHILTNIAVLDKFHELIGFEDTDRHKPQPEPYLKALELCPVKNKSLIKVYEDSPSGIKAAVAVGLNVVGLLTSFKNLPELIDFELKFQADFIC